LRTSSIDTRDSTTTFAGPAFPGPESDAEKLRILSGIGQAPKNRRSSGTSGGSLALWNANDGAPNRIWRTFWTIAVPNLEETAFARSSAFELLKSPNHLPFL